tara:strand:+ start:501 stop:764 length:264 start_codon:yes stop_codon:yes gene_type:complete
MTQQEEIKALCECVEGLTDAMKTASKSRDILLNVLQFEGHRIDALANKIDILMKSKEDEDEAEAEKRMDIIGQNGNDGEHYNLDGSV